ncbi:MAG: RDD family protein [Chloroflexi bacterium]|nr:RDD family protein [Chloroflexota bacterium]
MKEKVMTYELAGLGERFVALLIDGFIQGVIAGILFGAFRGPGAGASFLVGLIYYWYFWTRQNGQSPGKQLMRIRVVKADGSPLTDVDAIIRYIGYYINSVLFMLGWLWALVDSNRQGLHDKLVNTYVVKV